MEKKTVDELIEVLQALTPEQRKLHLTIEACDCIGEWNGEFTIMDGDLMLTREDGYYSRQNR